MNGGNTTWLMEFIDGSLLPLHRCRVLEVHLEQLRRHPGMRIPIGADQVRHRRYGNEVFRIFLRGVDTGWGLYGTGETLDHGQIFAGENIVPVFARNDCTEFRALPFVMCSKDTKD